MTGTKFLAASMLGILGLMPGLVRADAITLDAPIAGASVHTGGVDMVVYYVDREDHFEVVATYASVDGPFEPGRLRMALTDGDRVSFGLPGMATAVLYTFERSGETVHVGASHVGADFALLAE
jgi:hypothetical protein